jgi:RHS repeat-associated protein
MLPDGRTQTVRHAWNDWGNPLMSVDPVGRETRYEYAKNGIDLTQVRQKSAQGWETLAELAWNAQHRPVTVKDAAGQVMELVWNESGQLLRIAEAQGGNGKEFRYDQQGQLAQIIGPQGKVQAQYAYDKAGNLASETDSEGYTLQHEYDALNRRTKTTYPDGTATEYVWNKLDLVRIRNRHGKTVEYQYDAARQPIAVKDALRTVQFGYDAAGRLTSLTDGRGKVTRWVRDIQGRIVGKYTADSVKTLYEYDRAGRQIKRTDALGQKRIVTYGLDDRPTRIFYENARHPMAETRFEWNVDYPLLKKMVDGTGTTTYTYGRVGLPGALKLTLENGPGSNNAYRVEYDEAGRIKGWNVGEARESYDYDEQNQLIAVDNRMLGDIQYSYLDDIVQVEVTAVGASPLRRRYVFESNTGNQRLKEIQNTTNARNFTYQSTSGYLITTITETGGDQSRKWNYEYDEINRLQAARRDDGQNYVYALDAADNLHYVAAPEGIRTYYHGAGNKIEQAHYQYDHNGNRSADATRTYKWDAENRLIEIGYKDKPQRKTEFRYDGSGRRIAIIETNNKQRTETRYKWCGNVICQARDETDKPEAYYFGEGTYRPANGVREYYAKDHLGSVRDVLDEQGKVRQRYDYDPYGQLSGNPDVKPEIGYAGMRYHAASGLYLTKYRAYDPESGRWLSRDPIGEFGGINLYTYVEGMPIAKIDPLGLADENPAETKSCSEKILEAAHKLNNLSKYGYDSDSGTPGFGSGKNKCNLFVFDVLNEAGIKPPRRTRFGIPRGPATAGMWADPSVEIEGFDIVTDPQPGDIVAIAFPYADATGHVAVVIGGNQTIGAGHEGSHITTWPWDGVTSPQGTPVYRRCKD